MDQLFQDDRQPIPTCELHGRRTCFVCLHSYNCDIDGGHDISLYYSSNKERRAAPCRGQDALFIPQLDAHLGLTAGLDGDSELPDGLKVEQEFDLRSIDITRPPEIAPRDEWFHHCKECDLVWLSGAEGDKAAATHPSHVAMRDKRTLVCWVKDGGYQFAPNSKYNGGVEHLQPREAFIGATVKMLRTARQEVLSDRVSTITASVRTNSHTFIGRASIFRIVVLLSNLDLVQFVTALGGCIWWKEWSETYRTLDGGMYHPAYRLGSYKLLHELEVEVELLARHGITVKWYLIDPLVIDTLSSPSVATPARSPESPMLPSINRNNSPDLSTAQECPNSSTSDLSGSSRLPASSISDIPTSPTQPPPEKVGTDVMQVDATEGQRVTEAEKV
ncbi:hypothetical protein BKA67DRAFT_92394 [Truncatella angustata]|uniref:Uncharacterized protein n=1 Tax=Truncatella angustata TaxID=152316 RepID=A0A9P8RHE0_9PEZI|nr:uncharacterized protein BKA67DRAFT_92394 [Truncatella angustata]KAH6646059.1 hypothetical protein BKA67DRAFT_92394 [Truncatella angustata]